MAAQPTTPRLGANNGLDARPGHEPETIPPSASKVLRPGSIEPGSVSLDAGARLQAFAAPAGPPPRRTTWSDLLQRVFEVDALRCPGCGRRMRVLSAITDATVVGAILRCLALPARAPPLAAPDDGARGSVLAADESFSETSAFDFDQSAEEPSAESGF
jgi:hypothetical protein